MTYFIAIPTTKEVKQEINELANMPLTNAIVIGLLIPSVNQLLRAVIAYVSGKQKLEQKKEEYDEKQVQDLINRALANKDAILKDFQEQYKNLITEVIQKNNQTLESILKSQETLVQLVGFMSENQKTYAEMAMKRSEETASLLQRIESANNSTIINAFNANTVMFARINSNQEKQLAKLDVILDRQDKHWGQDNRS